MTCTRWPIGTAVGTGIVVSAKKERERLKDAMKEVQSLLKDYESKMLTASRLVTNLTFITVGHHFTHNPPPPLFPLFLFVSFQPIIFGNLTLH